MMDINTYKDFITSGIKDNDKLLSVAVIESYQTSIKNLGLPTLQAKKLMDVFIVLASSSLYIDGMMKTDSADIALLEINYNAIKSRFDIEMKIKVGSNYDRLNYTDEKLFFKNNLPEGDLEMMESLLLFLNDNSVFIRKLFNIKKYYLEFDVNQDADIKTKNETRNCLSFAKTYGGSVICTTHFVRYDDETVLYKVIEKYFKQSFEEIILRIDRKEGLKRDIVGLKL